MAERPLKPRLAAARAVVAVRQSGRSLTTVLADVLPQVEPADRGLVQEIAFGVLRWAPRLEFIADRLMRQPLKSRDRDVHALLLVGLYQLFYLSVPDHAAVSETVAASAALRKPWSRGLINGVLRNAQRQRDQLLAEADREPTSELGYPEWLLRRFREDWPEAWRAIAEAGNARPPMTLRVNLRRVTREQYLARLAEAGIGARAARWSVAGVILEAPVGVDQLPGFDDGLVSVQDEAAQLAGQLLEPKPGEHILDACAAPGGKTGHILEMAGDSEVVALDADAERLGRVEENLARLGLSATCVAADAAQPDRWWDGRPFDRILLDAPCSATGVIRRHPDIKTLRRQDDIARLVDEQGRLLHALWPLLKSGGMLVYSTCSVIPAENALQVRRFIADREDVREIPLKAGWGRDTAPGRQILPGEDGMDGFYFACLEKQ